MEEYAAKGIFRNGHTNSIIAGSPARKLVAHRKSSKFRQQAEATIIPAGHDIRLSAKYNRQSQRHCPTVILFHGWLGCADSLYLVTLGDFLFEHGFNVVRLNFRDHGDSHHLNEKIFHSCRIQEVINACIHIQQEFDSPISLVGFSLGANFALRVNAFTTPEQLTITNTVSFCPVIDPSHTLDALENSLMVYRNYFMQRWKTSFYQKAEAFPHLFSKQAFDRLRTLRDATKNLAIKYAGFENLDAYLNGYSIAGDRLKTLHVPATIILAKDDPIIPWQDKDKLANSDFLTIHISEHGGHCGFLDTDLTCPWIDNTTLELIKTH